MAQCLGHIETVSRNTCSLKQDPQNTTFHTATLRMSYCHTVNHYTTTPHTIIPQPHTAIPQPPYYILPYCKNPIQQDPFCHTVRPILQDLFCHTVRPILPYCENPILPVRTPHSYGDPYIVYCTETCNAYCAVLPHAVT